MRGGVENRLKIAKSNQDKLGKHDMFHIEITAQEKARINIVSPAKLELWFYKELALNRREYLDILCNRIGIPASSKTSKCDIALQLIPHIQYD